MEMSSGKEKNSNDIGEIRFCSYCGSKLHPGAKFCADCGKPIAQPLNNENGETKTIGTERKTVYEGTIHKCPNCGAVLESFVNKCPSCGFEIRDINTTNSVRELSKKLEEIEARKMPETKQSDSIMSAVFGVDLKRRDETERKERYFIVQKEEEKANLITNYSVPNTKEDILEFILLAVSNINPEAVRNNIVTDAWISKLDQVYQKAEITLGSDPCIDKIRTIYRKKCRQIRNTKYSLYYVMGGALLFMLFMAGLEWNKMATLCISVSLIVLSIISYIFYKKQSKKGE